MITTRRPPVARQERRLHHLRLLLPLLIALGLLAYISYLAASHPSRESLWMIVQQTWPLVVALIIPYLAVRLLVWHVLLGQLGIAVPWRPLTVAFAAGEITKSLPAGVYLQNYILSRLRHLGQLSAVRSTMATTAMLGLESLVALPVVLLIGLPGAPWARLTLLGIALVWIAVLLLAWLFVHYRETHMSPRAAAWRRRVVLVAEEFLAAGGELIALRTAKAVVPTALYMLLYALALYAIFQAAGVHGVSFGDTLGVYAILVLAVILVPIPYASGVLGRRTTVAEMADIGIILLLFALGVRLSFRDLLRVGPVALLGGTVQVLALLGLGAVAGLALGWPATQALFFGGVIAISSSAALARCCKSAARRGPSMGASPWPGPRSRTWARSSW